MDLLQFVRTMLTVSNYITRADLIFSLAGGPGRKEYALQLFHEGLAPAVLLSTGRFEMRAAAALHLPTDVDFVAVARKLPPPSRNMLYFYDGWFAQPYWFSRHYFGTLSEISALREWLRDRQHIKSLLIVSSGFHLRRIRLCCRALLPRYLRFHLVPLPESEDPWCRAGPAQTGAVMLEFVKIPAYAAMLLLQSRR